MTHGFRYEFLRSDDEEAPVHDLEAKLIALPAAGKISERRKLLEELLKIETSHFERAKGSASPKLELTAKRNYLLAKIRLAESDTQIAAASHEKPQRKTSK